MTLDLEAIKERERNPGVSGDILDSYVMPAVEDYEEACLAAGWKMCPRDATDDMVRVECAKMSAPMSYMKRKWAAMWDAATPDSKRGNDE